MRCSVPAGIISTEFSWKGDEVPLRIASPWPWTIINIWSTSCTSWGMSLPVVIDIRTSWVFLVVKSTFLKLVLSKASWAQVSL